MAALVVPRGLSVLGVSGAPGAPRVLVVPVVLVARVVPVVGCGVLGVLVVSAALVGSGVLRVVSAVMVVSVVLVVRRVRCCLAPGVLVVLVASVVTVGWVSIVRSLVGRVVLVAMRAGVGPVVWVVRATRCCSGPGVLAVLVRPVVPVVLEVLVAVAWVLRATAGPVAWAVPVVRRVVVAPGAGVACYWATPGWLVVPVPVVAVASVVPVALAIMVAGV